MNYFENDACCNKFELESPKEVPPFYGAVISIMNELSSTSDILYKINDRITGGKTDQSTQVAPVTFETIYSHSIEETMTAIYNLSNRIREQSEAITKSSGLF